MTAAAEAFHALCYAAPSTLTRSGRISACCGVYARLDLPEALDGRVTGELRTRRMQTDLASRNDVEV